MKIKHFIIIRFLCTPNLGFGEKIYDKDFIFDNIHITCKYLLPYLQNQSNDNFEIIYELNDKHDTKLMSSYFNENIVFKKFKFKNVIFLRTCEINDYISNNIKYYDFLITTRIDCDDLIYKYAVDDIQNFIKNKTTHYKQYLCGYQYGFKMYNDKDLYVCDYCHPTGFIAIFMSLISDLRFNNLKIKNVCNLGMHNRLILNFKERCTDVNDDCVIYFDNSDHRSFIYNKYETSSSSVQRHGCTEKTSFDKEQFIYDEQFKLKFKDYFGFELK